MEKRKIVLTSLLLALLLAMLVTVARGGAAPLQRTPGVSVGNTFTYGNVSFYWYSNDPNATLPSGFEDMYNASSLVTSVENVVNTNITCNALIHFKNGSSSNVGGWVDVDTGDNVNMTMWFISANLVANDSIYTGGYYQTWMINGTVQRDYPNGPRDTNYLNLTYSMSLMNVSMYMFYGIYWDQLTGAMTEMSIVMNSTTGYETDWSLSLKMTESSIWVIPEFVGLPQILLMLVSLTIVTVVFSKKVRKRTRTEI